MFCCCIVTNCASISFKVGSFYLALFISWGFRYKTPERLRRLSLGLEKAPLNPKTNELAQAGSPIIDFDDMAYMRTFNSYLNFLRNNFSPNHYGNAGTNVQFVH